MHAEVIDRNVFSLFQSTYCSNMVKHAEIIDRNVFSLFQSTYCSNMLKHTEVIDRNVFSLFQSTYCSNMVKHAEVIKRTIHVVNLDPAAEHFDYPVLAGRKIELFRVTMLEMVFELMIVF